jgi:hypothetical protein
MKYCSNCGHKLESGTEKFCDECGTPLVGVDTTVKEKKEPQKQPDCDSKCPACGNYKFDKARGVCVLCGHKVPNAEDLPANRNLSPLEQELIWKKEHKSIGVAILMNILCPGFGNWYVGDAYAKRILLGTIIGAILIPFGIGIVFWVALSIGASFHAYRTIEIDNQELKIKIEKGQLKP